MPVKVSGYIVNVSERVDASSNLVKRVQLEIHGSLVELLELMEAPLTISFEPMQPKFGDIIPERQGGGKKKQIKGA